MNGSPRLGTPSSASHAPSAAEAMLFWLLEKEPLCSQREVCSPTILHSLVA